MLETLRDYEGLSRAGIEACAQRGEFADFALRCRNDLRREQRRRTRKRKVRLAGRELKVREISLNAPVGGDGKPLLHFLASARADMPSSLATRVSIETHMESVKRMMAIVKAHEQELRSMDVLDGLLATAGNADLIPSGKTREFDAAVIVDIRKLRGCTASQAQAYRKKFGKTMSSQFNGGNSLVRAILLELKPPDTPKPFFAHMANREEKRGEEKSFFQQVYEKGAQRVAA